MVKKIFDRLSGPVGIYGGFDHRALALRVYRDGMRQKIGAIYGSICGDIDADENAIDGNETITIVVSALKDVGFVLSKKKQEA